MTPLIKNRDISQNSTDATKLVNYLIRKSISISVISFPFLLTGNRLVIVCAYCSIISGLISVFLGILYVQEVHFNNPRIKNLSTDQTLLAGRQSVIFIGQRSYMLLIPIYW